MTSVIEPAAPSASDAPAPPIVLTLAGRTFRTGPTTSIIQDAYVMQRMRRFGLDGLGTVGVRAAIACDPVLGESVIMSMFESGLIYEVLAGALVEEGTKWTRDGAEANAILFSELSDPGDKEQIWQNVAEITNDFLVGAAEWLRASLRSSTADRTGARQSARDVSGEPSSTTMASGTGSSASSPTTM